MQGHLWFCLDCIIALPLFTNIIVNVTSSTPHNLITPLEVAIHRFFPFHNIYIHSRAGPGVKNFVKLRRRESLRERVRSIIDNIITMHHHHHQRRGIHCHHHDPCHDFLCYHIVTIEARVALTSSSSSPVSHHALHTFKCNHCDQVVGSREYAKKHVWRRKKPERKIEDAPAPDEGTGCTFIYNTTYLVVKYRWSSEKSN